MRDLVCQFWSDGMRVSRICSNVRHCLKLPERAALFVEPMDEKALAQAMRASLRTTSAAIPCTAGIQPAALFDWRKTVAETVLVYREIAPWLQTSNWLYEAHFPDWRELRDRSRHC